MPYDPNIPAEGSEMVSAEMRSQFQGLKGLIDAGPPTDVVGGVPKLVAGPSDGINRFLSKDVSASSFDGTGTGGGGNVALVDGDFSTPAADNAGEGPGNVFIVDLGAGNEAAIQVLTISEDWHGGPDVATDATCDFRYSDDGATWVVVGSFVLPSGSASPVTLEFDFPNRGAHRWWSFIVTAGGPGQMMLREVQGFCRIPPFVPEDKIAPEIARVAGVNAGDAAVQAAAAADATAKADAAQFASAANSSANTNAVATLDTPFADPDTEALRQKVNEMLLGMRRS